MQRRQFLKWTALLAAQAALPLRSIWAEETLEEAYDYIVIGSGAGGGVVASRLARAGFSVLVIEAGPSKRSEFSEAPGLHLVSSADPEINWNFFVQHYTFCCVCPNGKALQS